MTRNLAFANRLREVFLNGTWIANTNYKEQLLSFSYEEAIFKISDLNMIALLTFHIDYYLKGLIQVMDGGELEIRDKYSFDLPEIKSAADWNSLVQNFLEHAVIFADQVEQMNEDHFHQPFVDVKYGNYARNIEAIIEHSYYHLGQISLIRKMIKQAQA